MPVSAEDPPPARPVHPERCGCTGCEAGRSVPLSSATWREVKAMTSDKALDMTGEQFTVEVVAYPAAEAAWTDRREWRWKPDGH